MESTTALLIGDLSGVAVFAAAGASAAVAKRLDMFGVVFVGFVAALGGGTFRDLVIGGPPPVAFGDWRYPATAAGAALAVFFWHARLERQRQIMLVLDAAGLALFTVMGTVKALDFGMPPVGACVLGMLTGIGGGLIRDLLVGEIPVVLRREIYALAAMCGAVAVVLLDWAGWAGLATLSAAGVLVFVVRVTALYRKWSAPRARPRGAGG